MNVRNCRKCGRMFNYVSGPPICGKCREQAEEQFQVVKKYIEEHKTATIPQIVEDCQVDQKLIHQWIREERLSFADDSPIKIKCEICGATISTGRYCEKCKKETAHSFNDISHAAHEHPAEPESSKQGSRMYTYGDRR
ncbi:MAG: flagellar protein [Lachnospiraceae bacterium]